MYSEYFIAITLGSNRFAFLFHKKLLFLQYFKAVSTFSGDCGCRHSSLVSYNREQGQTIQPSYSQNSLGQWLRFQVLLRSHCPPLKRFLSIDFFGWNYSLRKSHRIFNVPSIRKNSCIIKEIVEQ